MLVSQDMELHFARSTTQHSSLFVPVAPGVKVLPPVVHLMTVDGCPHFVASSTQHLLASQAYNPLHNVVPLTDPTLKAIAVKHGVSTAAAAMRYVSQRGISLLSATTNPTHMEEDIATFDFNRTAGEMQTLDQLQKGKHGCADCYTIECRTCRFVLDQLKCPQGYNIGSPNGTACVDCAARFRETVMNGCGSMTMAAKACGA